MSPLTGRPYFRAMPPAKRPPWTGEALVKLKIAQKKYLEGKKVTGKKWAYKRRTGSALTRQKESQKMSKKRLRMEKKQQQQQLEEQETVKRQENPNSTAGSQNSNADAVHAGQPIWCPIVRPD